jgi:hypothetical protein
LATLDHKQIRLIEFDTHISSGYGVSPETSGVESQNASSNFEMTAEQKLSVHLNIDRDERETSPGLVFIITTEKSLILSLAAMVFSNMLNLGGFIGAE